MARFYSLVTLLLVMVSYGQEPAAIAFTAQLENQPQDLFLYRARLTNPKIAVQTNGKFIISSGAGLERVNGHEKDVSFSANFEVFGNDDPGRVLQMQSDANGKLLVLTSFAGMSDAPGKTFVRLNPDGSHDPTFAPTLPYVYYFQLLSDGKILASTYMDDANKIVRLNADGSIDPTFVFNAIELDAHQFIVKQNGKIVYVGMQQNGMQNVAQLNSDGSQDNTFYMNPAGNGYFTTTTLLELLNGKILVAGDIDEYNGTSLENLLMLNADGTIDNSFNFATNSNTLPYVTDVALQSDGKILVAFSVGIYASNINEYMGSIVRLHPDGSIDTTFPLRISNEPTAITVLSNQDIVVQTKNTNVANQAQIDGVAKYDVNGNRDIAFNNGLGFSAMVRAMLVQPDGKILLGGDFDHYNGTNANKIVRMQPDGTKDETFSVTSAITQTVNALALLPDGKIMAGGQFSSNTGNQGLLRLHPDGSADDSFISPLSGTNRVNALVALPNGKVLVGGWFLVTHQNRSYQNMIRLNADGTLDTSFFDQTDNTVGFNNPVNMIVTQPDGKILVGGSFTGFYLCNICTGMDRIVRLNENGTRDTSFGNSGLNGPVHSIAVEHNGDILVGGDFNLGGVMTQKKFVRLWPNGVIKSNFTYYSGVTKSIAIQPDNRFLVGGDITGIENLNPHHIARLNADGTTDYEFQSGKGFNGEVRSIQLTPAGQILIAGDFTMYNNIPVRRFVALRGNDFFGVQGMNRFDADNNGCTTADPSVPYLKVAASNGNTYIPDTTGQYALSLGVGTHTLTPILEHPGYFSITPPEVNVSFPAQSAPFIQDFCISKNGAFPDLEVVVLPLNDARPGFDATYRIVYKNKGTETATGSLSFSFDGTLSTVVSTTPAANGSTQNTLVWNFQNLQPFESRTVDVTLNFNTPQDTPPLVGGESISFTASVEQASEHTPADNTFTLQTAVVNAFDPNDKTCLQGNLVGTEVVGEFVHYLIRFENVGNANARHIYILDEIDTAKFDIATLTPLNASHAFTTRIYNGNRVKFLFENINLPYSGAARHGYVAFKIKTVATLEAGDSFSNAAAIYFDYNDAVNTNDEITSIGVLSVPTQESASTFTIYPNPVADVLHIKVTDLVADKLEVYGLSGRLLMAIPNARQTTSLDVSHLPAGVYILKIKSEQAVQTSKFVKM